MCFLVILTFVFAINLTPFSEKVLVFINIFSMYIQCIKMYGPAQEIFGTYLVSQ